MAAEGDIGTNDKLRITNYELEIATIGVRTGRGNDRGSMGDGKNSGTDKSVLYICLVGNAFMHSVETGTANDRWHRPL